MTATRKRLTLAAIYRIVEWVRDRELIVGLAAFCVFCAVVLPGALWFGLTLAAMLLAILAYDEWKSRRR